MPSTREQKGVHHDEEEDEEEEDDDDDDDDDEEKDDDDDKDFNGSFVRVQQHQIHEHYIERSPSCSRF